jgi:hypothetical protein
MVSEKHDYITIIKSQTTMFISFSTRCMIKKNRLPEAINGNKKQNNQYCYHYVPNIPAPMHHIHANLHTPSLSFLWQQKGNVIALLREAASSNVDDLYCCLRAERDQTDLITSMELVPFCSEPMMKRVAKWRRTCKRVVTGSIPGTGHIIIGSEQKGINSMLVIWTVWYHSVLSRLCHAIRRDTLMYT